MRHPGFVEVHRPPANRTLPVAWTLHLEQHKACPLPSLAMVNKDCPLLIIKLIIRNIRRLSVPTTKGLSITIGIYFFRRLYRNLPNHKTSHSISGPSFFKKDSLPGTKRRSCNTATCCRFVPNCLKSLRLRRTERKGGHSHIIRTLERPAVTRAKEVLLEYRQRLT